MNNTKELIGAMCACAVYTNSGKQVGRCGTSSIFPENDLNFLPMTKSCAGSRVSVFSIGFYSVLLFSLFPSYLMLAQTVSSSPESIWCSMFTGSTSGLPWIWGWGSWRLSLCLPVGSGICIPFFRGTSILFHSFPQVSIRIAAFGLLLLLQALYQLFETGKLCHLLPALKNTVTTPLFIIISLYI